MIDLRKHKELNTKPYKEGEYGVKPYFEYSADKVNTNREQYQKVIKIVLRKIKVINPFGEYAFVNNSGNRMTTCCFRSRLYRVCRKLGIYNKSPHKIRKTYGSILLDNNVDKRFIIKQMDHADILCTETKYHRDRREHDEKMEIISNIPQFKAQ